MRKNLLIAAMGMTLTTTGMAEAAILNVGPSKTTTYYTALDTFEDGVVATSDFAAGAFGSSIGLAEFTAVLPEGAVLTGLKLDGVPTSIVTLEAGSFTSVHTRPGDGQLSKSDALSPTGDLALLNGGPLFGPFSIPLPTANLGPDGRLEVTFRVSSANGLHGYTLVDATSQGLMLTAEYVIPEPGALGLLAGATVMMLRRRK